MKIFKKGKKISKTAIICVFIFMLCSSFVFKPKKAEALIPVEAISTTIATIKSDVTNIGKYAWDVAKALADKAWNTAGSHAVKSAASYVLNTIAYDWATYLGSGGRGQKPVFWKDEPGGYFRNLADNTAGVFIEGLGEKWNMNLCEPDFNLKIGIALGLVKQERPKEPDCTWSKMKDRWNDEIKRADFADRFKFYFDSKENDLGIALELQTGIMEQKRGIINKEQLKYLAEGRWLPDDGISGDLKTVPDYARMLTESGLRVVENAIGKTYTDPFVDALNVFQTQLIYTLLQRSLGNLAKDMPSSSGYTGDYGGLLDYSASPYRGGIAGAKDRFLELAKPSFNVRGDYEILGSLSTCPSSGPIGTTDCVIDEKFKRAISDNLTVQEAVDMGLLSKDAPFGFIQDGLEPSYNQGYPYRSMKILRKYRIIPASWEVAAEYIKEKVISKREIVSLGHMLDCFKSPNEWCKGLIDPNWVLRAPLNYCKREGFGPEIISENYITASANDSHIPGNKSDKKTDIKKLAIVRDGGYCSDEQTCIKEKEDGSCEYYGYCAKEQRIWKFNADSCDSKYNTCQSFRSPKGKTVSYLTNTLDYENCDAQAAGCTEYKSASDLIYDLDIDYLSWNESTDPSEYFNDKIEVCSPRDEGCHQYLITDDDEAEKLIYQKILPDYLESSCYGSNYRYLSDAPQKCFNYGKKCDEIYAGCDIYTSTTRKFSIPAVAPTDDNCTSECVGYNRFSQSKTYFETSTFADFIPKTAVKCNSNAVGCDEFTNLDNKEMDGEEKEYYKRLKICEKPNSNCAEFYTWEGSDDQGYQLMVYSLKEDSAGGPKFFPGTYNGMTCASKDNYNPVYNPMCWEFYDKSGSKYYGFYIYTTTCSENCHPYRATNISSENCGKGGGVWDNSYKACIYMNIPEEGEKCSAQESGCRKYTGNQGNNTRVVGFYTFDKSSTEDWEGFGGATVGLSNVSLHLGGKSMFVQGGAHTAKIVLGDKVREGSAYILSFLVKSSSGSVTINSSFINSSNNSVNFGSVTANSDWSWKEEIEFSKPEEGINFKVDNETALYISGGGDFYIDNIKITEISDWHYLIKNSWLTPASCAGKLGCDEYKNSKSQLRYLTGFDRLCQDSDVGCELMIDTKNSLDRADDANAYIVYNTKQKCNSAFKACERMGKSIYYYENEDIFEDAYVLNDPDKSSFISCNQNQKGCQGWNSVDPSEGTFYFKDPKNKTCEYRQEGGNWDWYKTEIKRCHDSDVNFSNICLSSKDCSLGEVCIDMAVERCSKDLDGIGGVWGDGIPKTLGIGGLGNEVAQPIGGVGGWAGLCPSNQAGCTEYIDPDSSFNLNLFDNRYDKPETKIEPYTLYLDSNDNLFEKNNIIEANVLSLGDVNSNLRYNNSPNELVITAGNKDASLRKILIDYRKRQKIDKTSCAGVYNFSQGCIWFNERTFGSVGYKAVSTQDSINGVNSLIKVDPSRKCGEWLACTSYSKLETGENICLDIGLCNSLNNDGQCSNILSQKQVALKYDPDNDPASTVDLNRLSDLSGYTKVGYSTSSQSFLPTTLYPLSSMKQLGEISDVSNGNFEFYGSDGYPIGWDASEINPTISDYKWTPGFFSAIDNPISAQDEGIAYPLEGKAFLKYSPVIGSIQSEFIEASSNTTYTLSLYANTENFYINDSAAKFGTLTVFVHTYNENNVLINGTGYDFAVCPTCSYGDHNVRRVNLYYDTGKKWTNQRRRTGEISFKFKTGEETKKIKIMVKGSVWHPNPNDSTKNISYNCHEEAGTTPSDLPNVIIPENACTGTVYIDDIKLRPSLNVSEYKDGEINIPQTCRLYPREDSLSCEYYENNGKKQKGYYGYCLEYDQFPGNKDACLLWWPVESIKGDGVEQTGTYTGRFPLYYTVQVSSYYDEMTIAPETSPSELYLPYWPVGKTTFKNVDGKSNRVVFTPKQLNLDSLPRHMLHKDNLAWVRVDCTAVSYPDSSQEQLLIQQVENTVLTFHSKGVVSPSHGYCSIVSGECRCTTSDGAKIISPPIGDPLRFDARCYILQFNNDQNSPDFGYLSGLSYDGINSIGNQPHCGIRKLEVKTRQVFARRIVQTITPFGNNKRWSSRMSEGSSYEYPVNRIPNITLDIDTANYYTDAVPFGSLVPPGDTFFEIYNPEEWDGNKDKPGYQPIYYVGPKEAKENPNQARMGQVHYDWLNAQLHPLGNNINYLKLLFAESYNVWDYKEGKCTSSSAVPNADCHHDSQCNSACQQYCKPMAGSSAVGGACNSFADCANYWEGTCEFYTTPAGMQAGKCSLGCNHGVACATDMTCQTATNCFESCGGIDGTWRFCSKGHCSLSGQRWVSNSTAPSTPGCKLCISDAGCVGACVGQKYEKLINNTTWNWTPSNGKCTATRKTDCKNDPTIAACICGNPPNIENIKANGLTSNIGIIKTGYIKLEFNSKLDPEQLPLVRYSVDWGDGNTTVVSGIKSPPKTNVDNPHTLYHLYSYWDLHEKYLNGVGLPPGSSYDNITGEYKLKPKVQIQDNWGWCNGDASRGRCNQWVPFVANIVIKK